MRDLTRRKVARFVSRRLPGLRDAWDKACAVALVHELVAQGILREPPPAPRRSAPAPRRRRKSSQVRDT